MSKKHEKMLTIPGHKGNANQNHTNGYHQEHHQQKMLVMMQGKKNPYTLLVGM
jgi:hypothetical protein